MNKIICDKCKEEIKPIIEKKYLNDGIVIQFFRCNDCYAKVLIDITNKEIREKQVEMVLLRRRQDNIIKATRKDNLEEMEKLSDENIRDMDNLLKEIKEAKAELKIKYEGEL